MDFKKLDKKPLPTVLTKKTTEGKFWKGFKEQLAVKQIGAVSHIDFCEAEPHHFAITSATRVLLYNGNTRKSIRSLTRFGDTAHCGTFRKDGSLIVAGGDDGKIKVFDANSRTVLREFNQDKPVHLTRFSNDENNHVLSGADDATVRLWDVATGQQVLRLTGHRDYVRSGRQSPTTSGVWATGGYDHVCRLWDVREGKCTMELDHGSPIEAVTFLPSGTLIATAGGPYICIWDILGSGQMLRKLQNHQKTVTSLQIAPNVGPEGDQAPRLMSGSLDGHVKVFDLDTFKLCFASHYPGPILSIGINPACHTMAVGMANNVLVTRTNAKVKKRGTDDGVQHKDNGSFVGSNISPGDLYVKAERTKATQLRQYEKYLKQFRFKDALDDVLVKNDPGLILAMLEELATRGNLMSAIGGREASGLMPILRFIHKKILHAGMSSSLASLLDIIMDAYGHKLLLDPAVVNMLDSIYTSLNREMNLQKDLHEIQGALDTLLAPTN